jgi:hypothetical protein
VLFKSAGEIKIQLSKWTSSEIFKVTVPSLFVVLKSLLSKETEGLVVSLIILQLQNRALPDLIVIFFTVEFKTFTWLSAMKIESIVLPSQIVLSPYKD